MYEEPELRLAERIGIKYARMEAAMIEGALPRLKAAYEKTAPAKAYPWSRHSLMVVGALLADFCVIDRAPFEPGARYEWLQPPLKGPAGLRWGYTGYRKSAARFPTRKWKFGQNVVNWNQAVCPGCTIRRMGGSRSRPARKHGRRGRKAWFCSRL